MYVLPILYTKHAHVVVVENARLFGMARTSSIPEEGKNKTRIKIFSFAFPVQIHNI